MILAAAVRRSGLDALSARASNDSVEFPHFLANHAPMVLVALDKLGASPEDSRNGTKPIAPKVV